MGPPSIVNYPVLLLIVDIWIQKPSPIRQDMIDLVHEEDFDSVLRPIKSSDPKTTQEYH